MTKDCRILICFVAGLWTYLQAWESGCHLSSAKARVWSQGRQCGICGGQSDTGVGLYTVIVSPPVLCIHAINAALFRHHTPFTGQNQGCRTCPGLNHTCIKYNCKCTVFWRPLHWYYAHVPGKQCFACSCYKYIINRYCTCTLYRFYC